MAGVRYSYRGELLMPYCSQCGKEMRERRGGISKDILFWDCPLFETGTLSEAMGHDSVVINPNFPLGRKFDPMTGKAL